MKKIYIFISLFLIVITFFLSSSLVQANMINPEYLPSFVAGMAILVLILSIPIGIMNGLIESMIVYVIMKKTVKSFKHLFISIIIVNLITSPPTQLIAFLIAGFARSGARSFEEFHSPNNEVFLAEIVPFVSEYFLLRWQFSKLDNRGFLSVRPSSKMIALVSSIANLATFLVGYYFNFL